MNETDPFDAEATRVRASNILGRSDLLLKLFDFLLAASRDQPPPKEIEIAVAVFGKRVDYDLSQDAAVRVYVHRLRKKLDAYYAGPGLASNQRLDIPRGEYRIVLQPVAASEPDSVPLTDAGAQTAVLIAATAPRRWLPAALTAVALNLLAWGALAAWQRADDGFGAVRQRAPWIHLAQDPRPLVLAIGDYYIFGEIDRAHGIDRLVREYNVNSREELNDYVTRRPDQGARFKDLRLAYLPTGVAQALRDVMPVLAPTKALRDRIIVTLASRLTPGQLKKANIVYVGYLSGLGVLREPVFGGSRFAAGDSSDELIDTTTQRHYTSQEGGPVQREGKSVDYGYVSSFLGPEGNRIIILAGMRDIGLMQMTESMTSAASLEALLLRAGGTPAFEALYEVDGIKRLNVSARLMTAAPLKTERIWSAVP